MYRVALVALFAAACSTGPGDGFGDLSGGDSGNGPATETFVPPRVMPYVVAVDASMATIPGTLHPDDVRAAGNLAADWQIRHMDAFAASTLVQFPGSSPLQFRRLAHGARWPSA